MKLIKYNKQQTERSHGHRGYDLLQGNVIICTNLCKLLHSPVTNHILGGHETFQFVNYTFIIPCKRCLPLVHHCISCIGRYWIGLEFCIWFLISVGNLTTIYNYYLLILDSDISERLLTIMVMRIPTHLMNGTRLQVAC